MLLPLKQGLKLNLGRLFIAIIYYVVMLLPLKQGLKLRIYNSYSFFFLVVMLLPLKQGLKQYL